MTITTKIDEGFCEALTERLGLKLAPQAGGLRGSAQRASLMNLEGSPQDRVAAILAQASWAKESEDPAIGYHNWLISHGYLPKETARAPRRQASAHDAFIVAREHLRAARSLVTLKTKRLDRLREEAKAVEQELADANAVLERADDAFMRLAD